MEHKVFQSKQSVNGRSVTGFAAVFGNVDEGKDITHRGAFTKTLKENGERIRHLWQHSFGDPPTAKITDLREVGVDELSPEVRSKYPLATGGLMVTREYLDTPRGNEVLEGLKTGAITEMSFGFDIVKDDQTKDDKLGMVRNLREVKLYETSDVLWGMNPATRAVKSSLGDIFMMVGVGRELTAVLAAAQQMTPEDLAQVVNAIGVLSQLLMLADPDGAAWLGIGDDGDGSIMAGVVPAMGKRGIKRAAHYLSGFNRGAIPFKETPKAAQPAKWDGPKEISAATVDDLKAMCAWVDPDQVAIKTGYKLPHHEAAGEHNVVWNGVKAAMGALLGARGGIDIPDADRQAVYAHLAKHYTEFEQTPPDFKLVQLAGSVKAARDIVRVANFKVGRRNSASDEQRIQAAIDALQTGLGVLQELLVDEAAEPPEAEDDTSSKALTDEYQALLKQLDTL